MKKLQIIALLIILISSKAATAQSAGVPDTLAYLQSIVANKAQFSFAGLRLGTRGMNNLRL